jgi:hypothetical protein
MKEGYISPKCNNIYTLAPSMQFPSPKVDLTTEVLLPL